MIEPQQDPDWGQTHPLQNCNSLEDNSKSTKNLFEERITSSEETRKLFFGRLSELRNKSNQQGLQASNEQNHELPDARDTPANPRSFGSHYPSKGAPGEAAGSAPEWADRPARWDALRASSLH